MSSYPPVTFKVVGIEEFNVVPIVKGEIYTIIAESDDGTQWKTTVSGKSGWFPKQMCQPIANTGKTTRQQTKQLYQ